MPSLRCLVVDDSAQFLASARTLLEREGIAVVGVASTIVDALRCTEELEPDVVLVDINLGDESGFELARRLDERKRTQAPPAERPEIILVSTHADDFGELIAASRARGYLDKSDLSAHAIHGLVSGDGHA